MKTEIRKNLASKEDSLPKTVFTENGVEEPKIEEIKGIKEVDVEVLKKVNLPKKSSKEVSLSFYNQILQSYPLLSREQTFELAKKFKNSRDENIRKDIKDKLVLHNLRLVIYIAYHRFRWVMDRGFPLDDLIQVGIIGLMRAVEKYDYVRGFQFSTYAYWWIRQSMGRAIQDTKETIRLPVNAQKTLFEIQKTQKDLALKLGRTPTDKEVAFKLNLSESRVSLLRGIKSVASLDEEFESHNSKSDSDGGNLLQVTSDKTLVGSTETIILAKAKLDELCNKIVQLFSAFLWLSERFPGHFTKKVERFKVFFALNGIQSQRLTLEEASVQFGVTRERMRQVNAAVWRYIKLYYPQLELNEEKFDDLLEHIRNITGLLGIEVDFRELSARAKAMPSSFDGKISVKNMEKDEEWKGNFHVRASPAFIHWKPQRNVSPELSVIDFVRRVYDVKADDIRNPGGDYTTKWARCVIMRIMSKDLNFSSETIALHIFQGNQKKISKYSDILENQLASDEAVRKDVENLQIHFRKVMKL